MDPVTAIGILNEKIDDLTTGDIAEIDRNVNFVINEIGDQTDFIHVPYQFGENSLFAFMNTSYYHVHGKALLYPKTAANVTLTSGSGAWGVTGNIIEVIPANALNESAFDLHWVNISDISANCQGSLILYAGPAEQEVEIGGTRFFKSSNFIQEGAKMIQIPQQPKGTRISCKVIDSTVGTITLGVSFEGHYYSL